MACLEGNNRDYFKCKELSKAYFECRMDKYDIQLCVGCAAANSGSFAPPGI
jgi:hypothetical protein